jgi:hypothetical protein
MNRGFERLQDQFNENPLQVIAVGSLAAHGLAKLINAISAYKGRRTWDLEVDRRRYKDQARRR